jgi:formamidopyrimidine-DNA glycosylase
VRRGLQPAMEGARFDEVEIRRGDLRWPLSRDFGARLEGQTITGIGRRAKYLLADLASGDVLLMHLGMSGSFHVFDCKDPRPEAGASRGREPRRTSFAGDLRSPPQDEASGLGNYYRQRSQHVAHDHIVFHMSSDAVVTFNDPRRFGSMKIVRREALDAEPLLNRLGPEPLGNEFDAAMLARGCKGKKTSLKAALSDQRVVAGLGNIYVCEALHRARLSPRRMASTIAARSGAPNERAERLVDAIKAVLRQAIEDGGSTLRNHRLTDGELGMFQHHFRVYDREGEKCRTVGCRGTIKRIAQNGRSTFYCPTCQK